MSGFPCPAGETAGFGHRRRSGALLDLATESPDLLYQSRGIISKSQFIELIRGCLDMACQLGKDHPASLSQKYIHLPLIGLSVIYSSVPTPLLERADTTVPVYANKYLLSSLISGLRLGIFHAVKLWYILSVLAHCLSQLTET